MTSWIIVADAGRGRFFRVEDRSLVEEEALVDPNQRLRGREREADNPGRVHDSFGGGRHSMENKASVGDQDADSFARVIAHRVEELRVQGGLSKVFIFAPPRFLGKLRAHMDDQCLALVADSVPRDLTRLSAKELAEHVPAEFLRGG